MAPQPPSQSNDNTDTSSRDRLPFEPAKSRKQAEKKAAATKSATEKPRRTASSNQTTIPDVVSKRMVRRMALFCGIPTVFGMSTFVASYLVVSNNLIELPNVAVVLVSMGFFGLGVLGLSYGVLSASWDEEIPGSKLGWVEFTTNLGRMTKAWRSAGK
ncbi:PAM68 family protein [Oculatella sp. LEGE 06141]|uniref:PAM68 family protein n=1 Tax=Oculatella sp. LEGE 06141 TaxID=1828648 RepID=UPI001880FD08|nr:PAM68 family protein [Oculatella sp. LEGE 06141]MBE9180831.1 PAM68 family protein [Oculatella sp. LEGE 06141]